MVVDDSEDEDVVEYVPVGVPGLVAEINNIAG